MLTLNIRVHDIRKGTHGCVQFLQVSYLEIYQERIRDLLVPFKVDPQAVRAEWHCCLDSGASRCGSVKSDRNWLESSDDNVYEESMDGDTASYLSFGAGTLKSWKDKRAPSVCFDNPSTKKEYLKLREHPVSGPYVEGLSWKDVYTWEDMEQIMLEGAARRTLGATPTNKCSNRGHTLFTMRIVKAWFMTPVSQINCANEYRESLISKTLNVTVDYRHLIICQFRFSDRNSELLTKLVEISNKFVVVQLSKYKVSVSLAWKFSEYLILLHFLTFFSEPTEILVTLSCAGTAREEPTCELR